MKKLKERWGITSNFQFFIILTVFAITGSTTAWIAKPILGLVGITKDLGWYFYYPIMIISTLPLYQVILILVGTLFGQHKFFWNIVKKTLIRMKLGFLYGKNQNNSTNNPIKK